MKVAQACPPLFDPMDCSPWNSPGWNTGVGSCSLFQGIFPTQGSNPGLPHRRWILYQLSHQGSPRILEWVAYPFSRGIFPTQESNLGLPALQADSLPAELSTSMESGTIAHRCYLDFGKQYSFVQISKAERHFVKSQVGSTLANTVDTSGAP